MKKTNTLLLFWYWTGKSYPPSRLERLGGLCVGNKKINFSMHFEEDYTYHIYNRSNELIFTETDNYVYFLKKLRELILPYVNILAYCLLPNHFHLMLSVKTSGVSMINESHRPNTQILSKQ